MKLSVIIAGSAAACVVAYNAYSLTCGAQPSCSDLGYTYTGSTSDCIGTALKCPFNSSYFNCTKKADALSSLTADIVMAAMPQYSRRTTKYVGSVYTASSNGYLIGFDQAQCDAGNRCFDSISMQVIIDNVNVRVTNKNVSWGFNTWSYPVRKGSTYKVTVAGNMNSEYYFVPTI